MRKLATAYLMALGLLMAWAALELCFATHDTPMSPEELNQAGRAGLMLAGFTLYATLVLTKD